MHPDNSRRERRARNLEQRRFHIVQQEQAEAFGRRHWQLAHMMTHPMLMMATRKLGLPVGSLSVALGEAYAKAETVRAIVAAQPGAENSPSARLPHHLEQRRLHAAQQDAQRLLVVASTPTWRISGCPSARSVLHSVKRTQKPQRLEPARWRQVASSSRMTL